MILYRIASDNDKIMNEKSDGFNTFDYNVGVEYLHFFILPENAKVYKKLKYDNEDVKSVVYKCDIPYNLIKNNFGIGMYRWYYPHIKTPFLEVKISKKDFQESFIIEKTNMIKDEWCNKEIYNRFIFSCVDNTDPIKSITFNPVFNVELNSEFNFLNYFTKEDLVKEGIDVSNYPEPIDEDYIQYFKMQKKNSKVKNKLETLKKILLNKKENRKIR